MICVVRGGRSTASGQKPPAACQRLYMLYTMEIKDRNGNLMDTAALVQQAQENQLSDLVL